MSGNIVSRKSNSTILLMLYYCGGMLNEVHFVLDISFISVIPFATSVESYFYLIWLRCEILFDVIWEGWKFFILHAFVTLDGLMKRKRKTFN